MISIIKRSFSITIKEYRLISLLYAILFVLSFVFSRTFFSTLKTEANDSVALEYLLQDFDFAVFSDFMIQSANAFKPFLPLSLFLGLLYLSISILLSGGIVNQLRHQKNFEVIEILKDGIIHLKSYVLIFVYCLILLISLLFFSGMFFFVFASIAEGGSEKSYILWMLPAFLITALFISFVFLVSDYAKVIQNENRTLSSWESFGDAIRFVLKHPKSFFLIGLVFLSLMILSVLYLTIESYVPMGSFGTILFIFAIQQVFVFFKIACRILNLSLAQNYYISKL